MEIKLKNSVDKYMNKNVVSVNISENIKRIEFLFKEYNVSHLPVLNKTNDMVGIISKTDYLNFMKFLAGQTSGKAYTTKQMEHYTAKELMSSYVESLSSLDPISKAVDIFAKRKYHAIPILENGSVCGILTPIDILSVILNESKSKAL